MGYLAKSCPQLIIYYNSSKSLLAIMTRFTMLSLKDEYTVAQSTFSLLRRCCSIQILAFGGVTGETLGTNGWDDQFVPPFLSFLSFSAFFCFPFFLLYSQVESWLMSPVTRLEYLCIHNGPMLSLVFSCRSLSSFLMRLRTAYHSEDFSLVGQWQKPLNISRLPTDPGLHYCVGLSCC